MGNPFRLLDVSPVAAQEKLGIEGAEQDVRHVERSERPLLEERLELVSVTALASAAG